MKQVDILHPLTKLHWEECKMLPEGVDDIRCVMLNNRLYVSGRVMSSGQCCKIYKSSTDFKSWTAHTTPSYWFALATYNHQLVLIGGIEVATREMTNKLWTSDAGVKWKPFYPALPSMRCGAAAITLGDPEYLVVVGGERKDHLPCALVEIFKDDMWHTVDSIPRRCYDVKFSVHNEVLYLMGGSGQDNPRMYWCRVTALRRMTEKGEEMKKFMLWNRATLPLLCSCPVSFGQNLLVFGVVIGLDCTKVYAFSHQKRCWVHVGNLPSEIRNICAVNLHSESLMVIGVDEESRKQNKRKVFKLSLKGREDG